jgi:hypothetical protein
MLEFWIKTNTLKTLGRFYVLCFYTKDAAMDTGNSIQYIIASINPIESVLNLIKFLSKTLDLEKLEI